MQPETLSQSLARFWCGPFTFPIAVIMDCGALQTACRSCAVALVLARWVIGALNCSTKDVQRALAELIMLNGLLSCPDTPGVEKLCATLVQPAWLSQRPHNISGGDLGLDATTAGPGPLFMVKGWNRSTVAIGVLFAAYECAEIYQAGDH